MSRDRNRRQLGQQGEQIAADFLAEKGMELLKRNYRTRRGEIDIIARQKQTIVFVEVKTSGTPFFGDPATWVDRRKQSRLIQTAEHYLATEVCEEVDCRFDVVAIRYHQDRFWINHIENAFWTDDW
jgi:putative endonuclease